MKITSQTFTKASGSMAGMTGSRNKGGMYLRGRAVPINRNTAAQQVIRGAVAALVTAWQTILTDAQRAAWATYANNVTKVDTLGATIKISGNNWYTACNTPRVQAGLARVDNGPVVFNTGSLTAPVTTASVGAGTFSTVLNNADEWAGATGGALLGYASVQKAPTINFFKGPFQLGVTVPGATIPPTSPATWGDTTTLTIGNIVYIRWQATAADGRLTASFIERVTIVA